MPDIASGWEQRSLSSLVDDRGITYGVVQPGNAIDAGTPMLRVKDFKPDGLDLEGAIRIDPSIAASHRRSCLRGGEVLITLVGTVGLVAVAPPETAGWNVARAVGVIPVADAEAVSWVAAYLRSPKALRSLSEHLNTTVQVTLNLKDLKSATIPWPPCPERRRITSVLGALDGKIASDRLLQISLDRARRESFIDLTRDAARVPLNDLGSQVKGTIQPSTTPEAAFEQFSIPAFDDGPFAEACLGASMASGKTRLPDDPVVLYSKLNPRTPRVWRPVKTGDGTAVCSPEFVALRPLPDVALAWLDSCLRHDPVFQSAVEGAATGTTGSRQRIKPSDLLALKVPEWSDGAAAWSAAFAPLIAGEDATVGTRRRLVDIRDLLSPRLISGEIRVPATNDETEAVETVIDQAAQDERHVIG